MDGSNDCKHFVVCSTTTPIIIITIIVVVFFIWFSVLFSVSYWFVTQDIIIIIAITPLEIFTSAIADGLLLKFELQQVSLSLRDSSQYSSRSQ